MNNADEILIIILAASLIIFLFIAIIAGVYLIRVLRNIHNISYATERVVDSAEAVGEALKDSSKSVAAFRLFYTLAKKARKR